MHPLPPLSEFGAWVSTSTNTKTTSIARAAAASNILVAYARAYARSVGDNEYDACLEVLRAAREVRRQVEENETETRQLAHEWKESRE